MTRKFGPSRNASTGHTSTQSVYLHRMQDSVTTKVMGEPALSQPSLPSNRARNNHGVNMTRYSANASDQAKAATITDITSH